MTCGHEKFLAIKLLVLLGDSDAYNFHDFEVKAGEFVAVTVIGEVYSAAL